MTETFYVTTPIYYANSAPHLGSLYTTLVADVVARYKRQRGFETYFLTGTDEHGVNIERVALKKGVPPQIHVDEIAAQFQASFADFHLDTAHGGYDIFMRTTEPRHYAGASHLWRLVRDSKTPKGREPLYKGFYEGWFCAACATFKTEDEYSQSDSPGDAPLCLIHLRPLDRVAEESYFFRLSDYGEALLELLSTRPEIIRPEARRNEMLSFIQSGLQDLSVSRTTASTRWGIPVPDDPGHTMYVWFDALSNYITALGFSSDDTVKFDKFWGSATHLVGKDILRQHTIYWFAFLLAAGIAVPKNVFAHGMWLDRAGRKMSKTIGNTVDLTVLRRHFQLDAIRYFLLREMNFGGDGRFSYENLLERANADLASGLGNLASRTLTMIERYCERRVPQVLQAHGASDLSESCSRIRDEYLRCFDDLAFSNALEAAWNLIAQTDKYISDAKPWNLAKDETRRGELEIVLATSHEVLRWLAVMLHPVMPEATNSLWRQLGFTFTLENLDPLDLKWTGTAAQTVTETIEGIFPRIDKLKTMNDINHETAPEPSNVEIQTSGDNAALDIPSDGTSAEQSPLPSSTQSPAPTSTDALPEGVATFITIEDFTKIEMRVGEILTAEPVPKADKLLRFTIDVGEAQPRQVLAGIRQYYEPESLIGRRIVVVSNLAPRKLRGFESQGMVLAASVGAEGRPVLATFTEDVPNGARLK